MATPRKKVVVKQTAGQLYEEIQASIVKLWDLNEGDSVEVLRNVVEDELGSSTHESDNAGETYEVDTIHSRGIELSDGLCYPIFALFKHSGQFRINDDYTAEINEDGSISVGCVDIEFELLERIYNAAQAKNQEYMNNL